MIDDEKIRKEAFNRYTIPWEGQTYLSSEVFAFFRGAKWALQEFKKSLWHDAKEEPRKYALCLVYAKFTYEGHVPFEEYVTSVYTPLGWTEDYFPQGYDYTIIRWCYLSDLLPKGGGQ